MSLQTGYHEDSKNPKVTKHFWYKNFFVRFVSFVSS